MASPRITNAVPQGCLGAVFVLGCALMAAGLRALGRGRYAVLERKG